MICGFLHSILCKVLSSNWTVTPMGCTKQVHLSLDTAFVHVRKCLWLLNCSWNRTVFSRGMIVYHKYWLFILFLFCTFVGFLDSDTSNALTIEWKYWNCKLPAKIFYRPEIKIESFSGYFESLFWTTILTNYFQKSIFIMKFSAFLWTKFEFFER